MEKALIKLGFEPLKDVRWNPESLKIKIIKQHVNVKESAELSEYGEDLVWNVTAEVERPSGDRKIVELESFTWYKGNPPYACYKVIVKLDNNFKIPLLFYATTVNPFKLIGKTLQL